MIVETPLDAPDEEWLVWADAMQQAGDPRGELIALANHPEQLAKHITRHADQLLGPTIGRHLRKGIMRVTWRRARPDIVEVRLDARSNGPKLLAELLASPVAPLMRGLAITAVPPTNEVLDLTTTLDALREMYIPHNWTSLAFVDDRAYTVDHMITRGLEVETNLVNFGALPTLWPRVQHLEELRLVVADPAQVPLGTLSLPNLRSFTLHCLYWNDGTGRLLANARWPNLTSLELRLVEDFTIDAPDDKHAYRPVYNYKRDFDDPLGEPRARLRRSRRGSRSALRIAAGAAAHAPRSDLVQ